MELQPRVGTTRCQDSESPVVKEVDMQPYLSTACRALIVLGLFCPASMVAQDGTSTHTDTIRTAMNGNRALTRTSPCFEGRDSEQGKQRKNKAIANLPEFARFWLMEDVLY